MSINTPYGLSDRQIIISSVLQGDTWGTTFASVQADNIEKEAEERGYGYNYKDSIRLGSLGQVDDLICITEAGYQAHEFNAYINIKSAIKRLQFNSEKCKTMLIGHKREKYQSNDLFVDNWTLSHEGRGNNVTSIETFNGKVAMEQVTQIFRSIHIFSTK